jgi:fumarate hydratase, class II
MGAVPVPASAYYGAQTARAVENFPISQWRFPPSLIRAIGRIKKHAAAVNEALGLLPAKVSVAIQTASQEVIDGKFDAEFVVDVFQTGSGTSTNMNANEVIANRAAELLGVGRGDKSVHPNDHVNLGQSSNDVIPSAIHLAAIESISCELIPALNELHAALSLKITEFWDVLKIGRTHLQDATPIRLGQEFSGYASQVQHRIEALRQCLHGLGGLALGGTAVGTGMNAHPEFARRTIAAMAHETGFDLREAPNHFEAQASIDVCVETSGVLRSVAVTLFTIANDLRWLGSGPRCGLGEIRLPPLQPGSSIMPGKVNPVLCETVIQVAAQVIGHDAVVAFSGTCGAFELNTMLPVTAYNLLTAMELLAAAAGMFARRCIAGLSADTQKCAENVERSLALATALVPAIGYDKAAQLAHAAYDTGRTIREVALESSGMAPDRVERLLRAERMTGPSNANIG